MLVRGDGRRYNSLDMKPIIVLASVCVFLFGAQVFAQDVPQNWVRIESKSRDLSVALPEGEFLVDHDGTKSELWYFAPGRQMSVRMNRVSGAKDAFKRSPTLNSDTPNYKFLERGDFIGKWTDQIVDRAGKHSYWFNLASSRGSYLIVANIKKGDEAVAERFLRSIRLEGKPLLNTAIADPPEVSTVSVEALEISPLIKDALSKPEPKDLRLETDINPAKLPDPSQYSRAAVIIRRPPPAYTPDARRRRVSGSVLLRATLLADGTIGRIVLTKSLDQDLDRQAFLSAKQIKFIPAEMDGRPVDTTVQISYGFSVY
jgi:TonB family protein